MIERPKTKTPAELEQEFYSKPLYLSYSGLNKLLFSPKLYYKHYILYKGWRICTGTCRAVTGGNDYGQQY